MEDITKQDVSAGIDVDTIIKKLKEYQLLAGDSESDTTTLFQATCRKIQQATRLATHIRTILYGLEADHHDIQLAGYTAVENVYINSFHSKCFPDGVIHVSFSDVQKSDADTIRRDTTISLKKPDPESDSIFVTIANQATTTNRYNIEVGAYKTVTPISLDSLQQITVQIPRKSISPEAHFEGYLSVTANINDQFVPTAEPSRVQY
ncbi:hypothetical protein [Bacillus thuringiensis]|uniref:hypothetical protein n=1 Tax=Bacillus thuringiensis TaxID=1428 RepID=UPI003B983A35